jgi:hypothetical protein
MLSILFYTQMGYYGQFVIQQWLLKEAAREAWILALPDNSFFRVSLADIDAAGKWEEAGKECWYKEHLYDVIRQRKLGGVTWLFCLDDEREARLIRQSGELTHANHDHQDKKAGHSLTSGAGDVFLAALSAPISKMPILGLNHCLNREKPLPVRYTEIAIPPPKV